LVKIEVNFFSKDSFPVEKFLVFFVKIFEGFSFPMDEFYLLLNNRVKSEAFAKTICELLKQENGTISTPRFKDV
jgi:hypothetical protein